MEFNQFNKHYKYKSDKEKFNTSLDILETIKPIRGVYYDDIGL